ncbi:MAG TPA: protein kinase, partial [Thermoanaerobaculia bacterium]
DFIVMELVEGTSLDGRLLATGALGEEELLRVASQLAEGISAAHAAGVLHQDLKPANLRLTADGRLKILDFGLATLVRAPTTASATAHHSEERGVSGTLPYMAPEQFDGKADERTDIYQAGMVLYELSTGRVAFEEKQPAALMRAILGEEPAAPRSINPKVPAPLEPVILKSIDKAPERRYQTARELLVDIRRAGAPSTVSRPVPFAARFGARRVAGLAAAALVVALLVVAAVALIRQVNPAAAGVQSLAVLPLANVSRDPAQAFFADAMTYELITQLGRISSLRVTSQTSMVRYKGSTKSVPEIARELGVGKIVEGSVLRAGDRVRVAINLVDAAEDRQLWSHSYERNVNDLIALQGEIARAVAEEVRVRLTPKEAELLAPKQAIAPAAREEYLKGIYQQLNMPMNPMMARRHFERAVAIDPRYAEPYAGIAETYVAAGFFINPIAPMEVFPKVKELTVKAIELDPTVASAYVSRGVARVHSEWDWKAAESDFRRAIELNPSLAAAHHWYAHLLLALDRIDESVAESERAATLDPDNVMWGSCVGWHCLYARQYDASIARLQGVIAKRPMNFLAHLYLGRAYEATGRHREAIASFRTAVSQSGNSATVLAAMAHALARGGQRQEAEAILASLMKRSETEYVSAYDIAVIHAGLGDADAAFEWLEKSYLERSAWLAHIKWDERFADLRTDPRFTSLVRRIRLAA